VGFFSGAGDIGIPIAARESTMTLWRRTTKRDATRTEKVTVTQFDQV